MAITLSARLETVVQLAAAEAARRGHRHVTLEHTLWAMVKADESRAIMAACGADTDELARELDEYLELMEASARGKTPKADEPHREVLARAARRASVGGLTELDVGDFLVAMLAHARETYASMLLYAAGVTRLDVLRATSHGLRDLNATAPAAERLAVLLHNDHFTTMEFVVQVLRDVFGHDEARATELMLRVHREGVAVATVLPAREAIERAERVHELAEEAEFPLRVSLAAA
jgi:ATP-dependent Clp protease adapter protein ClpS